METRFEKILPVEQWQQILKNVPPGDLCRVVTTSKYMNGLASWPKLWTDMSVNVRKVRDEGLAKFYSIVRFKRVTKIDFSNVKFTSEQLESLLNDMDGSPLESINFYDADFRDIPAEVLARAVGQLKTFKLFSSDNRRLTTDQCIKILEAIVSSTTLANVKLENQGFSEVPAELLANAVSRLEKVSLAFSDLTTDQCIRILDASLSSATLVKMDLCDVDLGGVPTQLLVKAVCRLKTVKLTKSVFHNRKGRVIKIINENYGILAYAVEKNTAKRVYQVLFDVHDVWIGAQTLKDIGKTLKDVMHVGDYVKFNGVHFKYLNKDLATSVVIAENELFSVQFPATMVPIQELSQIQDEKLNNFKVVAKVVGDIELTYSENKILASLEKGNL